MPALAWPRWPPLAAARGACALGAGLHAIVLVPIALLLLASAAFFGFGARAEHAGMASAVNNDVARAASLIAVAVLPAAAGLTGAAYLHPAQFSAGFHTASLISAAMCIAGGAVAAVAIRNPRRAGPESAQAPAQLFHCGLDSPPARTTATTGHAATGQA